ncbi:MAG: DUF885 domain-containing protein [Pseudomonadota bacterium]
MQHKILIFVSLIIGLAGCNVSSSADLENTAATEKTTAQAQAFAEFKELFLDEYWSYSPSYGTYVGYYKYDDKLIVPNQAAREAEAAFLQRSLKSLATFDKAGLSASDATDYALIENQLKADLWYLHEFRLHQWDPSQYNVASIFGLIMNTEYKPLNERLRVVSRRLVNVPAYYQAAMESLRDPTPEHTDLAIQQNRGALGVFAKIIPEKIALSTLSEQQRRLLAKRLDAATDAIESYIAWLEAKKVTFSQGDVRSFRIGTELYEQKFKYDIVSDYTAVELYQKAIAEKERLHARMYKITEQLWPKYLADQELPANKLVAIKQLIDHLSSRHVKREDFVEEIRRQMPIIQKFMDDNKLLDSDPTRPLVVREAPEYQRGIAGASVDAPGPYDATANTYYNVTPLDDYTPEQAESYLREYNYWILQILNIHEATPGHYTQLMHANKSPSKIKSIFGNGAMIEGWAVYSELMMMEAGYGNNEPEMWLMYSKWNLRAVINTILDYQVHVLGMEQAAAVDMLITEGFQEQTEADGKWRRVTVSQVQLTSYFNGYAEILAFREELKEKMGEKFDLRNFHNKFLSYGNAPVPVIRRLMLAELGLEST